MSDRLLLLILVILFLICCWIVYQSEALENARSYVHRTYWRIHPNGTINENHPLHFIAGEHRFRYSQGEISDEEIEKAKQFREQTLERCGTLDFLPKFNPDLYNDPEFEKQNNCYEYGMGLLDAKSRRKVQPGDLSHLPHLNKYDLTCEKIEQYVKFDHPQVLFMDDFDHGCPCGYFQVGLFVDNVSEVNNRDYHFVRIDKTGFGSHKPGSSPVNVLDASNHFIVDLKTIDLNYSATGGPNYCKACKPICVPGNMGQIYETAKHPLKKEWQGENPPVDYRKPGDIEFIVQ